MDFLKEIINSITPTKEEYAELEEIFSKVKSKIKIKDATAELGGSGKKNTWLHSNHDIDIYIKFSHKTYHDRDISDILKKELKKHFKISILHGSRDYFQAIISNYTIEIIPIIDIKKAEEALNITDISPLHCRYVMKHDKNEDIRLAKAFCRANNCYGAESYIGGFSGYAIEILTIHYGSFMSLIKNVSKWKDKTAIGNRKDIEKLNLSKKLGPLILMDPVDKNRNAAAAVSTEKYLQFIKVCHDFLKKPSKSLFIEKKFDESLFLKKHASKKIVVMEAEPFDGKKDVIGAKILKCFNYLKTQFKLNNFKMLHAEWHWSDEALFYFVFDSKELSKEIKHYGPPAKEVESSVAFIKKYGEKNVRKEGNKLYVMLKRQFTKPEDYTEYLVKKDKTIHGYVKSLKIKRLAQ